MTEDKPSPVDERIRDDWTRLKSIQKRGMDVKKLMVSLKRITQITKKAKPEDIDRALLKLEEYLSKIEEQMAAADSAKEEEKQAAEQEPSEEKKDEPGPTESEVPPEPVEPEPVPEPDQPSEEKTEKKKDGEESKEPVEEKKTELPPEPVKPVITTEPEQPPEEKVEEEEKGETVIEEKTEEPSEVVNEDQAEDTGTELPQEPGESETAPEPEQPSDDKVEDEEKVEEEEPPEPEGQVSDEAPEEKIKEEEGSDIEPAPIPESAPSTEEAPQEAPKEEDSAEQEEKIRTMVEEIDSLDSEIAGFEGDTTPIQPHIDAMRESIRSKDFNMFQQYFEIAKDWLEKYLVNLISRANISMADEIKGLRDQYIILGKSDRVENKVPEMEALLNENNSVDLPVIRDIQATLKRCIGEINEDLSEMTADIESEVKDILPAMDEKFSRINDDSRKNDLKSRLDEAVKLISTDIMKAYSQVMGIKKEVFEESAKADKVKFELILRSIEPILSRLSEPSFGQDEVSFEMARERDRLVGLFPSNPEEALKGMNELLDKASLKIAEMEEELTEEIEASISALKKDLEEIEGMVDTQPVINIIQRASDYLEDGIFVQSRELVEKGYAALARIKEKEAQDKATSSLNEILSRRDEMAEMTIDTSPLDGPIEEARKAIENGDLDAFDKHLELLKQKLSLMKGEELKVEYQKLLIKIMNEVKDLKMKGQADTKPLEEDLTKVKDLFLSKDLEASVDLEREIISKIKKIKLTKNVMERMETIEKTIEEADGLLVDIEKPRQNVAQVREMMEKEMVEEALDLLVETQVDIEYRMTSRTFSMIEKEIRDGWKEAMSHSIDLGDMDAEIKKAYDLADDDMFKEALEHLYSLKENVMGQVEQIKAKALLTDLSSLIKNGRSLGLKIATFKASHTKSKVLLESGDPAGSIDLSERQISALKDRIANRKVLQDRLDSLRGRLIGLETKISMIMDKGLPVNIFRESMKDIQEMIGISEADKAEEKFNELDSEMNMILTGKTAEEIKAEKPAPAVKEMVRSVEPETPVMDLAEAKRKLMELVAIISNEMKKRSVNGQEIESVKGDIKTIQGLVIKKDYISALEIANSCMVRLNL